MTTTIAVAQSRQLFLQHPAHGLAEQGLIIDQQHMDG
jgi:hypothetical protein